MTTKQKKKQQTEIAQTKIWKNIRTLWDGNKTKPRTVAVAAFRLETGHDCLAKHNILPSDNGMLCRLPDTVCCTEVQRYGSTILGCPKENGSHTTNLMPLEKKKEEDIRVYMRPKFS